MVGSCPQGGSVRNSADMRRDDAGGIVLGWLTRVAIVIGVLGVIGFDAVSIMATELSVTDQAATAAAQAAQTFATTRDTTKSYAAAVESASAADAANTVPRNQFTIDRTGVVHLAVVRDADTLVFAKWSRSRQWAHVSRTGEGHVASP